MEVGGGGEGGIEEEIEKRRSEGGEGRGKVERGEGRWRGEREGGEGRGKVERGE